MLTKKRKFSIKHQYSLIEKGKKGCSTCGKILDLSRFQRQNTDIGYRSSCKYCRHVKNRSKRGCTPMEENDFYDRLYCKDKSLRQYKLKIKRTFKLSDKYLNSLLSVNNCEVCGKSEIENGRRLSVDHCHDSGEVRGVLCDSCNKGLGNFLDSINSLKKAIIYLKNFNEGITKK